MSLLSILLACLAQCLEHSAFGVQQWNCKVELRRKAAKTRCRCSLARHISFEVPDDLVAEYGCPGLRVDLTPVLAADNARSGSWDQRHAVLWPLVEAAREEGGCYKEDEARTLQVRGLLTAGNQPWQ